MRIGGQLPEALVGEFAEVLSLQGAGLDWGETIRDTKEVREALEAEGPLEVFAVEMRWGRMRDVESFCEAHGLSYEACTDESIQWWTPGMEESKRVGALEYEAMVPIHQVRSVLADGERPADERLDDLEAMLDARTPARIPNLVMVPSPTAKRSSGGGRRS